MSRWVKLEGGHKRGHSNMTHWEYTEIIKAETKKARRQESKRVIKEQRES